MGCTGPFCRVSPSSSLAPKLGLTPPFGDSLQDADCRVLPSQDLIAAYGLQHSPELRDERPDELSPYLFCTALAERKGYRIARGRGSLDLHRAGLDVLKDCVDGALCLAFEPPPPSPAKTLPSPAAEQIVAAAQRPLLCYSDEAALREVLAELEGWAAAQVV